MRMTLRRPPRRPEELRQGEIVLEAEAVGVSLGGTEIVSGVSFEVRAGEVLAIIGPNGAGKTTLLGAVAGDHRYTGSIRLRGREISDWSARELAVRRSVLRQQNALSFPFRVVDVVKMGRAPWRDITPVETDDRIVAQELVRTDTLRFAERPFTSLSGGERARVALARAMAQRAGLLLLDEPSASLDVNYQEHVLALARMYAGRGSAVVVVLHDLAAAAAYSDRILMIDGGGMRVCGTPAEVMQAALLSEVYRHPIRVIEEDDGSLLVVPRRFADERPEPVGAPEEEKR
ncbi:heme ABC transporter ATP-binding protein [Microbacterium tumbae]